MSGAREGQPGNCCANCRFLARWNAGDDIGFCVRRAPGVVQAEVNCGRRRLVGEAVFPKVSAAAWCGEHENGADDQRRPEVA
jgi:hypothetical protein